MPHGGRILMGWRPLRTSDLPAALTIAERVHPAYPEDEAVFAERLRLAPAGCFLLESPGGAALGYLVSHPWRLGCPPALDTLLGRIPDEADTCYIHDLALLSEARGTGAAGAIVTDLIARTATFPTLSLVAVNGSAPFWTRHGFATRDAPDLAAKLASYGGEARYMVRPRISPS